MKFRSGKKVRPFSLRHPYLLPVFLVFGFVISILTAYIAFSGETVGAKDTRIVNLVIDGNQQVLATRSRYVSDLVAALELNLKPTDKIEPALETPIIEDNQRITIYRSRPVVVVEGTKRVEIISAEQDPAAVAAQAGLAVTEKDIVVASPYDDPLASGIAAEKFEIYRAIPVTANIYGALASYQTQSKTIGEFLKENNLTLKEGESIQPEGSDTPITPNMLISINAKGKRTLATTEPIPFKIETKTDASLPPGQSKTTREGVAGERAIIYEITYEGEVEVARRQITMVVTREPVNEIRARASHLPSSLSVAADKQELMRQAGIDEAHFGIVDFIISRESGWRPGAVNSSSGAYGLCQSLPASKMATAGADYLTNPVTQLRWCAGYAQRYGGWPGAYAAWQAQHWW